MALPDCARKSVSCSLPFLAEKFCHSDPAVVTANAGSAPAGRVESRARRCPAATERARGGLWWTLQAPSAEAT